VRLAWRIRALPLTRPLIAAWGELRRREVFEVSLRLASGEVGRGEAAPLEPYDGVAAGAVDAALDAYAAVLRVLPDRLDHAQVLDACAAERRLPQALAAIDLCLWDIASRRTGQPVAQLLADGAATSVALNATIGALDRAGAAAGAAEAVAAGFECVKVKVGVGDDAGRLAAVRAAVGPVVAIRVDANGAWSSPEEALANLRALAPAGIELAEEPVHGIEALRAVRAASPVPVAMDETAAEPGALEAGAADLVCLKIAACGGMSGVLEAARAARRAGSDVYVASTFDGPLGIAAGRPRRRGARRRGPVPACVASRRWAPSPGRFPGRRSPGGGSSSPRVRAALAGGGPVRLSGSGRPACCGRSA
jgi:L-alanine-DL-glutamate epimerase-like enolase superfamily enzyme